MAIYDLSEYDEDVYDGDDLVPVQVPLAFAWGLEPLPEEDEHVAQRMAYVMRLQRVTDDDVILSEDEIEQSITIPDDISGAETYQIKPNTVDQPIPNLANFQDVVMVRLSPTSPKGCVVKFNTATDTPFTIRPGGMVFVDAENILQILVSNPDPKASAFFRITRGVRQTPAV